MRLAGAAGGGTLAGPDEVRAVGGADAAGAADAGAAGAVPLLAIGAERGAMMWGIWGGRVSLPVAQAILGVCRQLAGRMRASKSVSRAVQLTGETLSRPAKEGQRTFSGMTKLSDGPQGKHKTIETGMDTDMIVSPC